MRVVLYAYDLEPITVIELTYLAWHYIKSLGFCCGTDIATRVECASFSATWAHCLPPKRQMGIDVVQTVNSGELTVYKEDEAE